MLKAKLAESENAKVQPAAISLAGRAGMPPAYTSSNPNSPDAEMHNPYVHVNEYQREALYSSHPPADSSAQYAHPSGSSRRRVTVSELQPSPRGQTPSMPMTGSVPTTRMHSPVQTFGMRQNVHTGPPGNVQLPPRFGPGPHSHPSTPSSQQGPFFALAAASGVVLSEQEVRRLRI